ncbi:DUF938 domain-containing protein [Salinisphaera orenii]|uniref:Methylase n=1 Tax=Salinisphaera orenii YIM 95161 TaxID=1051139 RepID=A0A423PX74_9GAMM|nr:DUF938 domain-containing protein [Salinisphaera halophila]ROO30206.1 methylase [Salinisphaera halophila YIM 95161]
MSTRIGDDSAAERNKQPIFEALAPWLVDARRVLEVGAGDGTHAFEAVHRLPQVIWQTSEAPAHHRRLVAALVEADMTRLPAPLALDVRGPWPAARFDAVFGANVAHIMDWDAVGALFAGAGACLNVAGLLCLYGPFIEPEASLTESNARFDAALRARDPAMGLRRLDDLDALAGRHGLDPADVRPMPANNRLVIWRRRSR